MSVIAQRAVSGWLPGAGSRSARRRCSRGPCSPGASRASAARPAASARRRASAPSLVDAWATLPFGWSSSRPEHHVLAPGEVPLLVFGSLAGGLRHQLVDGGGAQEGREGGVGGLERGDLVREQLPLLEPVDRRQRVLHDAEKPAEAGHRDVGRLHVLRPAEVLDGAQGEDGLQVAPRRPQRARVLTGERLVGPPGDVLASAGRRSAVGGGSPASGRSSNGARGVDLAGLSRATASAMRTLARSGHFAAARSWAFVTLSGPGSMAGGHAGHSQQLLADRYQ
jgi:hypothetical protein